MGEIRRVRSRGQGAFWRVEVEGRLRQGGLGATDVAAYARCIEILGSRVLIEVKVVMLRRFRLRTLGVRV